MNILHFSHDQTKPYLSLNINFKCEKHKYDIPVNKLYIPNLFQAPPLLIYAYLNNFMCTNYSITSISSISFSLKILHINDNFEYKIITFSCQNFC